MVATSWRPPEASVSRPLMIRSMTVASSPLRRATRSRNAGSKAISPFIERAVMAATCSLTPISSANSSMHSWSIMVESMSASRIFLARPAASCTATSIGSEASASRKRACAVSRSALSGRIRSQAISSASHRTELAPTACEAIFASECERRRCAGCEMRVATSGMGNSGKCEGGERVKDAILIAGPTASGKSALALDLAIDRGGVIVNADSMQVYSVLDVLTARPSAEDQARAPHFLYGHVSPATLYSTGAWLRDVGKLVAEGRLEGKVPIFVGGTGLYFRALTEGISNMPDMPSAIREGWRGRMV